MRVHQLGIQIEKFILCAILLRTLQCYYNNEFEPLPPAMYLTSLDVRMGNLFIRCSRLAVCVKSVQLELTINKATYYKIIKYRDPYLTHGNFFRGWGLD